MGHKHFGPSVGRDEPVSSDRNAVHFGRMVAEALFPAFKIDGATERCEHHKLGERYARTLRKFLRRLKRIMAVGRQSEDERSEDMDPVMLKLPKSLHQVFAR